MNLKKPNPIGFRLNILNTMAYCVSFSGDLIEIDNTDKSIARANQHAPFLHWQKGAIS